MPDTTTSLLTTGSGAIVGLVLVLVGGGGSILAVPLLVYLVGVSPPHVAIGTSALAVSASAFGNLLPHARAGNVKWRCASVFAAAGVVGALLGAEIAKALDGDKLLFLFGLVMVAVGLTMFRKRDEAGDPDVRLTADTARELLPLLLGIGFAVGLLSGFFGIGGGFLIVPGLILATGMPLTSATAASYAVSGLIDWTVAALFIAGGVGGGVAGVAVGRVLARRKRALSLVFATIVVAAGTYVLIQGFSTLAAAR